MGQRGTALQDPAAGEFLLTPEESREAMLAAEAQAESERAARDIAEAQVESERTARAAAEARLAEIKAELRRLRGSQ